MKPRLQVRNSVFLLTCAVAVALVAGCSKNENKPAAAAASQVAAKVNSTEITVSQINSVLAKAPNVPPENIERAKRDILDKLINEEIAKSEAITRKLDRNPEVLQALETAKREVLTRAYADQIVAGQPKPTPDEIKKYYAEHPELFSQRRVFSIEEISLAVKGNESIAGKLGEMVAKARTLDEVAAGLKAQGVQFAANKGVRAAEQLPLEFLPEIQKLKDGEMHLFQGGAAYQIIRVAASKAAPVTEAVATPRISQFLFNRRSTEAVLSDIKVLREKAKVEFVGEFAVGVAEAEAKAKAAAEARTKAAAEAKAKAEAESQAQADQLSKARAAAEATVKSETDAQLKLEEAARARREAEAKAAREADAKKGNAAKPTLPAPDLEKGVRGLTR